MTDDKIIDFAQAAQERRQRKKVEGPGPSETILLQDLPKTLIKIIEDYKHHIIMGQMISAQMAEFLPSAEEIAEHMAEIITKRNYNSSFARYKSMDDFVQQLPQSNASGDHDQNKINQAYKFIIAKCLLTILETPPKDLDKYWDIKETEILMSITRHLLEGHKDKKEFLRRDENSAKILSCYFDEALNITETQKRTDDNFTLTMQKRMEILIIQSKNKALTPSHD